MISRAAHRKIRLKAAWEIEKLRRANRIVAEALLELKEALKPGITTLDLDRMAEEAVTRRGGKPAFKGYRGYPATLCVSVNDEVVHGIPSGTRVVGRGDLVSMDLGSIWDGYYGDAAISTVVEPGDATAKRLIEVTKEALMAAIAQVKPKNRLYDISAAVQTVVEENGYSVVKQFVGHGIGKALHEPPEIPNYGTPGQGPVLKPGMVLAIEPMVNAGSGAVKVLADGWTAVTMDGSLSAHYEHSVAVTENGAEILSVAG